MLNIGCHLSTSKGYHHMGQEALSIDANTFQFFTRNPRGSKAKKIDPEDVAALISLMAEHQFAQLLAHAPYTLNPCSADPKVREFADLIMKDDMTIMEYLPNNYYTFHPGSHVGQGVSVGIDFIVELLNKILQPDQTTLVLLETMSGKGSEVGSNFEEINTILSRVDLSDKMGVCLDTCHIYSAGYDIINDLDRVLEQFDRIIGLNNLKAIHLNDSLTPYSSHKDRHARIGEGTLGLETIVGIINHPQLRDLPFYLETPNEIAGYAEEIKLLRSAYKE
ncbi:MAG: deoxyribonuclease IV [Syntrophomonas sp.]|nr:deoxyribonuclease IV [Syntrophomonas sp.]